MTLPEILKWSVESSPPTLQGAEVHVWRTTLDSETTDVDLLYSLLPAEERLKADRFQLDLHRRRYITAHATLRRLIGAYLAEAFAVEPFVAGPNGKPALAGAGLRFNLSHAGALGLFAFALEREVGIDLETVDPAVEVDSVARTFFSQSEWSSLLALPSPRRVDGFYHVWSQKEAYLKARGEGVAHGLDHFDVAAEPDRPASLLADRRDPLAAARWKLFTLEPGAEFRGALAVEGRRPIAVRQFEYRQA